MTLRRLLGIIAILAFVLFIKITVIENPGESNFVNDAAYHWAYAFGFIFMLSSGYAKIKMILNKKSVLGSLIGCLSLMLMVMTSSNLTHSFTPEQLVLSENYPGLLFLSSWFLTDLVNLLLPIEKSSAETTESV